MVFDPHLADYKHFFGFVEALFPLPEADIIGLFFSVTHDLFAGFAVSCYLCIRINQQPIIMRKFFAALLLTVSSAIAANATVLFPFFVDLVGNYDGANEGGSALYSGKCMMSKEATDVFLADVLPSDVTTTKVNKTLTVLTSAYSSSDTMGDNVDKVYAIYLITKGETVYCYYSESTAADQKLIQDEIEKLAQ